MAVLDTDCCSGVGSIRPSARWLSQPAALTRKQCFLDLVGSYTKSCLLLRQQCTSEVVSRSQTHPAYIHPVRKGLEKCFV